jgi:tRNA(adenine34) deaminase
VFGAFEPRAGAMGGEINYFEAMSHLHKIDIVGGVLGEQCKEMMQQFFRSRR